VLTGLFANKPTEVTAWPTRWQHFF